MNYIESDREGEFFNPASETVQINPSESTSSDPVVKEYNENLSRWEWLIKGWPEMSFKERMALFTPYVRIVRLINQKVDDFDEGHSCEGHVKSNRGLWVSSGDIELIVKPIKEKLYTREEVDAMEYAIKYMKEH